MPRALAFVALSWVASCTGAEPRLDGWIQVETEHVRLRSMQDEDTALRIATGLQRSRDALATAFLDCPKDAARGRIEVTTLPENEYDLVGPRQSAGFYRRAYLGTLTGKPGQIVVREELASEGRQVFQHEIVHRLVASCYPQAPRWLNEGLASFLETAEVRPTRMTLGIPAFQPSTDATAIRLLWARQSTLLDLPVGWLPSASAVVAMNNAEFYGANQNGFERVSRQATAWALVHYLEIGAPDLRPRFDRYRAALRQGTTPPAKAWADQFGAMELDARLREYLTEASEYVELEWTAPQRAAPSVRPLGPAEAELHWAWLWSFGTPEDRLHALQHAERASGDPRMRAEAALVTALARLAAGEEEAARQAVDRGLAKAPTDASLLALAVDIRQELRRDQQIDSPDIEALAARLLPVAVLPEHQVVLSGYALESGDVTRALAHSQRAVSVGPSCWRCWASRAAATTAAERWPEALAALDRATNLLPDADEAGVTLVEQLRRDLLARARERGVDVTRLGAAD